MKEIIFIGDSLTEFYDWQNRFPEYSVQNLGNAGEPVEDLFARLRRLRIFKSPDYLFLMTGINNLRRGDHEIPDRYRDVLDYLAVELKDCVIVIQSILPVTRWVHQLEIEKVNIFIGKMAIARGMHYLDLYKLFLDSSGMPDAGCLEEDGVHLSDKGYGIWSKAVENFLYGQK
jgi:lysophospholipase L1-like esterase